MHTILKGHGKITGVLFNKNFADGPPFGGDKNEYESLFSKKFTIEIMNDCYNSVQPMEGVEVFIKLVKKPDTLKGEE